MKKLFALYLFFYSIYLTQEGNVQYQKQYEVNYSLIIPSTRIVMPVCKLLEDKYLCPHCLLYNNIEECELFSSSCRNSGIQTNQYPDYCDNKYGQWRTKFIPANYSICQCCDDCVFYRDLRAGCNPYKEHPSEVSKALECNEKSDTCVQMNIMFTKRDEIKHANPDCEHSTENIFMLEIKRGLPYKVQAAEPCKLEMMTFKKQFGIEGHSHFNAPQCTPLWKYRPVQCRGLRCYCVLQDGTPILGFDVPRAEVSNMNCACAREKCNKKNDTLQCDGYGNYKKFCFVYLKEGHPPLQGNHVPLLKIEKLQDEIVYTPGVQIDLGFHSVAVTSSISSTKIDDANNLSHKIGTRLDIGGSPSEFSLDTTSSTKLSIMYYHSRNNAVLIPQLKFFFDDNEPL